MQRHQTPLMKMLLKETDKCELCGSRRGLEVHHIIPVSFGGPEDDADNLIVVCVSCHSRLTPRKILTKSGIEKALVTDTINRIYDNYYMELGEWLKSEECIFPSVSEALDIFDKVIDCEFQKAYKRKSNNQYLEYMETDFHKKIARKEFDEFYKRKASETQLNKQNEQLQMEI